MDDAEFRRGKPAVHRIYGEGIAILAALGFLNQAYRILWDERLAGILGRETVLFLGGMLSGAIGRQRNPRSPGEVFAVSRMAPGGADCHRTAG